MNTIVIDASALVKRVLAEPDSEVVRAWFDRHSDARFVGPALLFAETGRILQKNQPRAPVGRQRALHSRLLAGVHLIETDDSVWDEATDLTFYDAHYVRLAAQLGASLATTDRTMADIAKARGIPVIDFAE